MLCFNRRLQLAAAFIAPFVLAPVANAQSAADQAAVEAPPAVYTPTSLDADPGLPRTPDGRPDFQDVVWTANSIPMLESSPLATSLVLPEAEAKAMYDRLRAMLLSNPIIQFDPEAPSILGDSEGLITVRGERRTRAVVLPATGKLPYTAAAREEVSNTDPMEKPLSNPEERPAGERCLAVGGQPPVASTLSLNPRQFIQTPDHVVIHTEYGDEARIVPFSATHRPLLFASRMGNSIARWDADTLVVETIGLPAEDRLRPFPTLIVSETATVIERFTRLTQDELLYQYTIIDPGVYTAPWLAEYSLHRTDDQMYPHACHEGNYSLPNILKGARMSEAAHP